MINFLVNYLPFWDQLGSLVCFIFCNYNLFCLCLRIRKCFIAKCVYTHKAFVLVLGASSTEMTNIVHIIAVAGQ